MNSWPRNRILNYGNFGAEKIVFTNTLWRHATPSEVGQASTRDGAKEQVTLSAAIEQCTTNLFWSKPQHLN